MKTDRAGTVPGLQTSLFGSGAPSFEAASVANRTDLGGGAWIELVPGWLHGDETLFEHLVCTTTWHEHRRPMYDRMVDVPRRTASLPDDGPGHRVLDDIAASLASRFGTPFTRIGLAHYRDGRDSVAPHGDQVARNRHTSIMATVSLGAPRRFVLSRIGGDGSLALDLGRGDLLVMGGTVQRTWTHAVPKTTRPVGPRMCVMFRPDWMS